MNRGSAKPWTRRGLLARVGAAATVGSAGCSSNASTSDGDWSAADAPAENALYDVVMTVDGPLAVGEGGRTLVRRSGGWERLLDDGPAGDGNGLVAAAAAADGRCAWFCGSSGALGRYAAADGRMTDHSAPRGKTSSWAAVAVVGRTGQESVYALNGSGELLRGRYADGAVSWGSVTKPADGLSVEAMAASNRAGLVCDADGGVYRTTTFDRWTRVGVDGVSATLHDVAMLDADTANVVADDGSVLLYNGFNWVTATASEDALHAVDRVDDRGLVAGVGGTVHVLGDGAWTSADVPTSDTLHGAALGLTDYPDVVVGDDGTVLERPGGATR